MIQVAGKHNQRILPEMGQVLAVNRSQEEEEPNGFEVSNRFVFEEEEETSSNKESPKQKDVKKFCSMFMIGKRNIFKLQKSDNLHNLLCFHGVRSSRKSRDGRKVVEMCWSNIK